MWYKAHQIVFCCVCSGYGHVKSCMCTCIKVGVKFEIYKCVKGKWWLPQTIMATFYSSCTMLEYSVETSFMFFTNFLSFFSALFDDAMYTFKFLWKFWPRFLVFPIESFVLRRYLHIYCFPIFPQYTESDEYKREM